MTTDPTALALANDRALRSWEALLMCPPDDDELDADVEEGPDPDRAYDEARDAALPENAWTP